MCLIRVLILVGERKKVKLFMCREKKMVECINWGEKISEIKNV